MTFLCALIFIGANQDVFSYEIDTHDKLSEAAVAASALNNDQTIIQNLGIQRTDKFLNSNNEPGTFDQLIRDGARFEDNLSLISLRPLNHFFNPLNGAPLTFLGKALGETSPDWALEDRGAITGTLGFGKQEYSYQDGREFFYRALTGRDVEGTVVATTKIERDRYFGLTFQTLGQVIHHIQDMAQPQHVRNDSHQDLPLWPIPNIPGVENPSTYEKYTNLPDVRGQLPIDFSLIGYDLSNPKFVETFKQPRKFWETTTGEGLAQFTNYNFVSAGTNFDNSGMFNFPLFTPSLRTDMDIQQLCVNAKPACPNPNLSGKMAFYGNWVEDRYTGQKILNPFASTRSIFDADLEKVNAKKHSL